MSKTERSGSCYTIKCNVTAACQLVSLIITYRHQAMLREINCRGKVKAFTTSICTRHKGNITESDNVRCLYINLVVKGGGSTTVTGKALELAMR